MKNFILLLFAFLCCTGIYAQKHKKNYTPQELAATADEIKQEGLQLYRSEKASWVATDMFFDNHIDTGNIGGYFSYPEGASYTKCVFYSRGEKPSAVFTVVFNGVFSPEKAIVDVAHRPFTPTEETYYLLRKLTMDTIANGDDFTTYEQTRFNVIPLLRDGKKYVYIITASAASGVIAYGNDYRILFDGAMHISSVERLHKGLITMKYGQGQKMGTSYHTHLGGYSLFPTPTDICTAMLYADICHADKLLVLSAAGYTSVWSCKDHTLQIGK